MLTNKRKEKISAFLDNDMHRDELMSFSLSAEADDAAMVRRYQMMGDALRGEMSDSSFVDVSHAVREILVAEESYAAVTVQPVKPVDRSTKVQPMSDSAAVNDKGFFNLSGWFKPVAGIAVAASVAVVMVVTVSEQETVGLTAQKIATDVATQPAVQLAVDNNAQSQKAGLKKAGQANQNVDPHLVNQHLEYATQDTLQGRLPLVRSVSYEAEK